MWVLFDGSETVRQWKCVWAWIRFYWLFCPIKTQRRLLHYWIQTATMPRWYTRHKRNGMWCDVLSVAYADAKAPFFSFVRFTFVSIVDSMRHAYQRVYCPFSFVNRLVAMCSDCFGKAVRIKLRQCATRSRSPYTRWFAFKCTFLSFSNVKCRRASKRITVVVHFPCAMFKTMLRTQKRCESNQQQHRRRRHFVCVRVFFFLRRFPFFGDGF